MEGDQHVSRSNLMWLFEMYCDSEFPSKSNDINKLHNFMLCSNQVLWVETQSESLVISMDECALTLSSWKKTQGWNNCILCCNWDRLGACSGQSSLSQCSGSLPSFGSPNASVCVLAYYVLIHFLTALSKISFTFVS